MARIEVNEHSPEWHAIRRRNIGGSEIAALFGLHAGFGQSAYTLHHVKAGHIEAPPVDDGPGSRVWFGVHLEPVIAKMAAELYGWKLDKGWYCTDDTTPGMACSLDYVIAAPGDAEEALGFTGPGVLQLKNTDWLNAKREWVNGEPPHWIVLQLQHEMACAGLTWGAIVPLVGGNELPVFRYAARPRTIAEIRQTVSEFWDDVRAGREPPADGRDSTAAALKALYPTLESDEAINMEFDNRMPDLVTQFLVARENRKASNEAYDTAKNEIEEKLKGHTRAYGLGWNIKVSVRRGSPDRAAKPGEIIKGRAASRTIAASQDIRIET